ncbi:S-layer homology domain-containing protein [Paenibacillus shenyangensis]|uniref:S-layer homology domain-containing protein n=1 Tax=Paenibacillus sp. A9 TaxID=1284352 RepID=UPI0003702F5A|nr:S-layer homology domain-containing protein [Paenibacillus sp. A9]
MLTTKIRPWAILLLSTAILLPTAGLTGADPVSAQSVNTTDIQHHWAKNVLIDWQNKGYISGFQDGSLQPDQSVTRSQLAALINKSFGFTSSVPIHYRDVQPSDWYYNDIAIAKAQGYMEGYKDSTFHPEQQVTRQELAVILTSIKKLKSSGSASRMKDTANSPSWSKGSIGAVIDNGLMNGDEKGFRPKDTTTRAEAVTVLNRSLQSTGAAATVYNTAGVYGPASGQQQISGNVQLNAAGSTLRNMVINGDLLLGQGIGEGDALLDHVTVKGTTTVNGGGSHSIHVKDSNLATMVINKKDGDVRVETSGSTVIQQTVLQSGAILEEKTNAGASGFNNVVMSSLLPTGARVTMNGRFDAVDIAASSLDVQLVSGSIDSLAVASGTTGNRVDTTSSSSIQSATLNAPATIGGNGTVENAYIRAEGVTITPRVMQTSIDNGITARVGGNTVGLPSTPTNTKKKESNHNETTTPVNETKPTPNTDVTAPPQIQHLDVKNGQAVLPPQAGDVLFLSDMNITATLDGVPINLRSISYDSVTRTVHFDPLKLLHYNGKVLQVKIAPVADFSRLTRTFQGSVQISGFIGVITDTQGEPVNGVKIMFRRGVGVMTGPVEATVTTGMDGNYTVQLPPGIYTGEMQKDGFLTSYMTGVSLTGILNDTENGVIIQQADKDQVHIILTWDEFPQDEDVHLLGPTPDGFGFQTDSSEQQYIYNGEVYAELNYDAIQGYGPEALTIRKRTPGTYTFYVDNISQLHSGSTATLRHSSARVEVYDGQSPTPIKTYLIPAGDGNEPYWHVFDMNIADGQLSFTDRNLLLNAAPVSKYLPIPTADSDQAKLEQEADLIPDDIVLPYDTKLNQEITLADKQPADGITRTVSSVELLSAIDADTDNEFSVTNDVYLSTADTGKGLQLLQYNGSPYTAPYKVTVSLRLGDTTIQKNVYVDVPNLDTWLNQAAIQAQSVLAQPAAGQDTTGLQTALDHKNALPQAAAVQDKITVLQELNAALQQLK